MEELLFLAHRIPYPPNKGDKIRSWHILKHLSRSCRVHLGAFVDDPGDWRYRDKIEQLCASTCLFPLHPASAKLRSLSGLLHGTALSLSYFRDRRMQRWVNTMLGRSEIQKVFVFSSPMAQYVLHTTSRKLQRVVDFVPSPIGPASPVLPGTGQSVVLLSWKKSIRHSCYYVN